MGLAEPGRLRGSPKPTTAAAFPVAARQASSSSRSPLHALFLAIPSVSVLVAVTIWLPVFLWMRFGSPLGVAKNALKLVLVGHAAARISSGNPGRLMAALLASFFLELAWAGWLFSTLCLARVLVHLAKHKTGPPPRMGGVGPVIFTLVCLISSALLWAPGAKAPQRAPGNWGSVAPSASVVSLHQERRSRSAWGEAPAAIVGGGVVLALDRLRLVAKRRRRPKEKPEVPEGPAREVEHGMRSGSSMELLGCFWRSAALLDSADARWILVPKDSSGQDRAVEDFGRASRDSKVVFGTPCFVLGETKEMVVGCKMDHLGGLVVVSDPWVSAGLISSIGLQFACWPGAGLYEIVLVGFEWLQQARELPVRFAKELSEVVDWLARRALASASGDDEQRERDPMKDLSGGSEEVLVVMGYLPSDKELGMLSRIAGDGSCGVHVVTAASKKQMEELERPGWIALRQDEGGFSHEAPGVLALPEGQGTLTPLLLDQNLARAIGMLLSSASRTTEAAMAPEPRVAPEPSQADEGDEVGSETGAEVTVCVLGPVGIEGGERSFSRSWAFELVIYLAMHKGGVPNDIWATALWPERVLSPATLHSTVSVARRCLGRASDGEDHLPHAHGKLWLRPTVTTDYERFCTLAKSEDPRDWEAALALVKGEPFQGLRAGDWAIVEGFVAEIETKVVDLAERLASWQLGQGNARAAQWAARQGLKASKYDERLYRVLMLAADALGHPQGVESVFRELVALVAEDLEPFDAVHPDTVQLYRGLSRRRKLVAR